MLKERKALFFTFCLGVVLLGSACSGTVYADADSITKNWLISQYANNCVNREKDTIESAASGKVIDSIMGPDTNNIALPSFGFNGLPADGIISCKKLLSGKGGAPSILSYKDPDLKNTKWSDTDGVRNPDVLLRGVLKYTPEGTAYAFRIAARNESDDQLVKSAQITAVSNSGALSYSRGMINPSVVDLGGAIGNHELEVSIQSCMDAIPIRLSSVSIDYTYDMIHRALDNKSCQNRFNGTTYKFEPDSVVADKVTPSAKKYTGGGSRSFVAELNSGINDVSLSKDEIYDLYYFYLDKKLPTGVVDRMTCEQTSTTGLKEVKLAIEDRTVKKCYVNFNGEDPKNIAVNVVNNSTEANGVKFSNIRSGNMQDVIDWLNRNLTVGEILETSSISSEEGESSEEEGERDPCYDSSGSLGWILCPIVTTIKDFLEKIYEECVEPFLVINTGLLDTSEGQGTYGAWQAFVGIANVLMIIVLLIIIFSQLTGVGINNYGIKKTLPKLILVAVLLNLSFIICQLAVDISNILGSSLNNLLTSMASGLQPSEVPSDSMAGGTWFRILLDSTLAVGGVAATTSLSAALLGGGASVLSGLIIPIVIALVAALIAILFFFVLLGIRQAAVVILVAISPLAFVCYMLPNTKKLFDKWLDLFKKMLLIYPIAGLTIGACNLATAILTSAGGNDDFLILMVCMLLMVLPFFLIPSVIKGSMNALGMVTSKINGFGQKFGERTRRGLNKANELPGMQARQQKAAENKQAKIEKAVNKANARTRDRLDRKQRHRGYGLTEEEAKKMDMLDRKDNRTEEEEKQLKELKNKATGGLNDAQVRRLANARVGMNEYEKKRDAYRNNSIAAVAAGQRARDQVAAEKEKRDAMDWHQGHFMGADGTIYNRSADGKSWIGADKDGEKQTISDETARLDAAAGNGAKMISHSEALLAKDSVGRSEQYGQLAGMARAVGQGDVNEVADAAAASALRSSVDSVEDTIVSGQGDVLKVEHDKAQEKRRGVQIAAEERYEQKSDDALRLEAIERNESVKGANAAVEQNAKRVGGVEGLAKSAEASRQAAEKQFINTIAENNAANRADAKLSEAQFNQAVAVNAQKLDNANMIKNAGVKEYFDKMPELTLDRENVANIARKKVFQEAIDNNMKIPAPDYGAMKAAAESKQSAEALASEMSKIKARASLPSTDPNYMAIDNDKYADALKNLLGKGSLTGEEQLEAKAFMSLLASGGGYGQKKLASVVSGAVQGEFAAKFMSKDSTISSAIATKSPALAQYMREVNNGSTTVSFDDWMKAPRDGFSGTNAQFVVEKIVDKDEDLARQADGSFKDLLDAGVISNERLSAIYNNKEVYNSATDGVRRMIATKLGRPYDRAEYNPRTSSGYGDDGYDDVYG